MLDSCAQIAPAGANSISSTSSFFSTLSSNATVRRTPGSRLQISWRFFFWFWPICTLLSVNSTGSKNHRYVIFPDRCLPKMSVGCCARLHAELELPFFLNSTEPEERSFQENGSLGGCTCRWGREGMDGAQHLSASHHLSRHPTDRAEQKEQSSSLFGISSYQISVCTMQRYTPPYVCKHKPTSSNGPCSCR